MSRPLPSLNGLRAFEAAARHLSFAKAAEELNVTPAALSYQIRTLEEYLGLKLFRRLNRQVVLTEAGQRCFPGVRDGFERLAGAMALIAKTDDSNVLRVTAGPSLSAKWLAPRLYRFLARHPEIDMRVTAQATQVDFDSEPVDVAIRFGSGNYPGLVAERLVPEYLLPLCSPKLMDGPHPLRTPEDLRHHTLIHDDMMISIFESPPNWNTWLAAAGVTGIDTTHGPRFDASYLAHAAALDGAGVVLGRRLLSIEDIRNGRLVAPFPLRIPAEGVFWFVCRPEAVDDPKITAFKAWVREEMEVDESPEA